MDSQSPSQTSPPLSALSDDTTDAVEQDPFIAFVQHARSVITPNDREYDGVDGSSVPSWRWIVSRILNTCACYSSGVTPAILLSDLFQAWSEQRRYSTSKKMVECLIPLEKRHRRTRLPNTVTIDSVYEKNFLSPSGILEAVVVDAFVLPGTNVYMLSLGDLWSSSTIDMYLHRRYYHLVDPDNGILKRGREVILTGCCLRAAAEGSGNSRLLPTEYLVILLNEEQDEDALLLGAHFCSDSFSSISVDAVKNGTAYSFYARIESIGALEVLEGFGGLQRKQITLVDNDGIKLKFLLWGEQVILSNLFSIGSMLALDRPFISKAADCYAEANQVICLEYGSATQLYLVPFVQHEEQVLLASTQMRYQGSRLLNLSGPTQGQKPSQVSLPLNSQGSIDFSNYPFRSYVIDLRDKMTGVSLYGAVADIKKEHEIAGNVFSVVIADTTGVTSVKLHFVSSWSLGRLSIGHVVFISGLSCSSRMKNRLEVSWFQKDPGTSFVDVSCLPALLNSSCLHRVSCLSDISSRMQGIHVCKVSLDHIEHHSIHSTLCHAPCGHPVKEISDGSVACSFCCCSCDGELVRSFYINVNLADRSGKVFAWCTGQTAVELLQISPDEFYVLPEVEQAMYLYTLGVEKFMVSIAYTKKQGDAHDLDNHPAWEIVRAQKCGFSFEDD